MPRWLKTLIELAVVVLKRTGQIDPNVNKKPEVVVTDPSKITEFTEVDRKDKEGGIH